MSTYRLTGEPLFKKASTVVKSYITVNIDMSSHDSHDSGETVAKCCNENRAVHNTIPLLAFCATASALAWVMSAERFVIRR